MLRREKGSQNMVRRSRLETYIDVLKVIDKGIDEPARIMHESNLSGASHRDAFDTLTNNGFIREEKGKNSNRYYVTKRGRNVLSYHSKSF